MSRKPAVDELLAHASAVCFVLPGDYNLLAKSNPKWFYMLLWASQRGRAGYHLDAYPVDWDIVRPSGSAGGARRRS